MSHKRKCGKLALDWSSRWSQCSVVHLVRESLWQVVRHWAERTMCKERPRYYLDVEDTAVDVCGRPLKHWPCPPISLLLLYVKTVLATVAILISAQSCHLDWADWPLYVQSDSMLLTSGKLLTIFQNFASRQQGWDSDRLQFFLNVCYLSGYFTKSSSRQGLPSSSSHNEDCELATLDYITPNSPLLVAVFKTQMFTASSPAKIIASLF